MVRANDEALIVDEEFFILYDVNVLRINLNFPCWNYGQFDLDIIYAMMTIKPWNQINLV